MGSADGTGAPHEQLAQFGGGEAGQGRALVVESVSTDLVTIRGEKMWDPEQVEAARQRVAVKRAARRALKAPAPDPDSPEWEEWATAGTGEGK